MSARLAPALVALATAACDGSEPPHEHASPEPFAVEVASFTPGDGAGFGQDRMPDIVLGPPDGGTTSSGSVDVVSLGGGGEIVLRMGIEIVDGEGADLIVFENPFEIAGQGTIFGEPGEVSVSDDGEDFVAFPCSAPDDVEGCAGFGLVIAGSENGLDATDPAVAGGDAFDLASVGLARASFVKIVDRGAGGPGPSAGFDLDAVAVVRATPGTSPGSPGAPAGTSPADTDQGRR